MNKMARVSFDLTLWMYYNINFSRGRKEINSNPGLRLWTYFPAHYSSWMLFEHSLTSRKRSPKTRRVSGRFVRFNIPLTAAGFLEKKSGNIFFLERMYCRRFLVFFFNLKIIPCCFWTTWICKFFSITLSSVAHTVNPKIRTL